jgi:hypothetical protein
VNIKAIALDALAILAAVYVYKTYLQSSIVTKV